MKQSKIISLKINKEGEAETTAIQRIIDQFSGWLIQTNTALATLCSTDIYARMLALAGGPGANRWNLELAYTHVLNSRGDVLTHSEPVELPVIPEFEREYEDEDEGSVPGVIIPPQPTDHKAALAQVRKEKGELDEEETTIYEKYLATLPGGHSERKYYEDFKLKSRKQ